MDFRPSYSGLDPGTRCLVVGGGGYVGSRLCERLRKLGLAVASFDRRPYKEEEEEDDAEEEERSPATEAAAPVISFQGDITSIEDVRCCLEAFRSEKPFSAFAFFFFFVVVVEMYVNAAAPSYHVLHMCPPLCFRLSLL